ncbi:hypothetical protein HYW83_06145 [Candidatus Peregrinibacteria bacterium]|nr:hypothetical protein [Candidatus Peregrinibacteria bacterium]
MNSLHWIIAAVIAPIPLFHLWLHALLPFWRKRPLLIYFVSIFVWAAALAYFYWLNLRSEYIFEFNAVWRIILGYLLMAIGTVGIFASIITLGPKRFFVWAVLKPHSVSAARIEKGPFRFIPHPAYIGYLFVAVGSFMSRGQFYLLYLVIYLFILTPIVIYFEEEELRRRVL